VASERLVTVTLAQAWDPAGPDGAAGQVEFDIVLDPQGHPDLQAWLDDPDPWPARRLVPGAAPEPGDVVQDDEGWQLRFFGKDGQDPDAPGHRLLNISAALRPGEVLTLRAPDGAETAWRVVRVSRPGGR
jgi:hypothetical protein